MGDILCFTKRLGGVTAETGRTVFVHSMNISAKTWPLLMLMVTGGLTFSLSCLIADVGEDDRRSFSHPSGVEMIMGQARFALSGYFYEMADVYLHKGVDDAEKRAFENGIFMTLSREISPEAVVHVAGHNMKEMMPWIWLAIRTDPHNLNPYLVGAYLLSREIDRPDLAHEVLREAQWNNPFNYEAPLEDARVYLKEKKITQAKHDLEVALAFWPGGKDPNDMGAKDDKVTILLYRGLLHETDGDTNTAIESYREILRLFPDRLDIRNRLNTLKPGSQPSVLATRAWHDMLNQQDKQEGKCHREGHDGDHGGT